MMSQSLAERASSISRDLLDSANNSTPTAALNKIVDLTINRLECRDSMTPPLVAPVINRHLLKQPSLSAAFFNWASHRFCGSSGSCHSVFKSLYDSGQFMIMDKLIKEAESRRLTVDTSIYGSMTAAYVKNGKSHEAFCILARDGSLIESVGAELCNLVLVGLVSDGLVDSAIKLFHEMVARRVSFSTLGLGLFVSKYCTNVELGETFELLDEVRKGFLEVDESVVAILIIHELCKAGRISEAFSALDELRSRGFKPDFMAYRIVAEAYRSKRYVAEVHEVLKKKRKFGVAPRATDYRQFIFDLISEGRMTEAIELGEVIVSGNFPFEDDVLGSLIESASAINSSSAMIFFEHMIGKDKLPALSTFNILCRNLRTHDKLEDLSKVFQTLSSIDYFIDVESYRVMILHFSAAGRVRDAYDILRAMKRKGIEPDISCYNILMEACCKEDLLKPAKKLWDKMFANGVTGNLKTYNILINKLVEEGQFDDAQTLLNHMLMKRVLPDANTVTPLLEGLCHFLTASELLCGLLGSPSNLEPHVILLKCIAEARQFHVAIEHMKNVMDISPSLLEGIYKELLAWASSCSDPDLIIQLLRQMPTDLNVPIQCSQLLSSKQFYV
ncbi:Pentatricopeptide repeat-containing protein [Drosera capensis]